MSTFIGGENMTVEMMIKQLKEYPMDSQVCDTYDSPIIWMGSRGTSNMVYLEPKDQTDIDVELEARFAEAMLTNASDNDVAQEIKDLGITLDDLRSYREDAYQWAKQTDVDW